MRVHVIQMVEVYFSENFFKDEILEQKNRQSSSQNISMEILPYLFFLQYITHDKTNTYPKVSEVATEAKEISVK